jgi:flagellar FliL protein
MAKKPKAPATESEEGQAEKPGGLKGLLANKLVLIGVAGMVVLAAGSGWWFMGRKKEVPDSALEAAKAVQKKTGFVEMKEMLVNISGAAPGERQNFIKVRVSLEIADSKQIADITPLLPRIEDLFQVYLRELRPADLEGSAGTYRLREELHRRVNMAVHPMRVEAILFRELLVQ